MHKSKMDNWIITNGDALENGVLEEKDVFIRDGMIDYDSDANASVYDAGGKYVLPGIIDVHGDAFERIIQPRPGVFFEKEIALREADRQMISNGITTAFHGLGVSWKPGVRSIEASRQFFDVWGKLRSQLLCETFLNLRWEIYALDPINEALEWLEEHSGNVLSVNDHATPFAGLNSDHPRIKRMAGRIGISPEESFGLLSKLFDRTDEVSSAIDLVCSTATKIGRKVLAHDETSIAQRIENRALGIDVSEFPMTKEAAQEAVSKNEHVVLGAPNVVRGGSQNNALCAKTAIGEGMCTVLASDYYYPAQLIAVSRLVKEEVLPIAEAWNLVSKGPAEAVGLVDRGDLKHGKKADAIVVDKALKHVSAVFVDGRLVYQSSSD